MRSKARAADCKANSGLSERTFARRLSQEEGLTFSELLGAPSIRSGKHSPLWPTTTRVWKFHQIRLAVAWAIEGTSAPFRMPSSALDRQERGKGRVKHAAFDRLIRAYCQFHRGLNMPVKNLWSYDSSHQRHFPHQLLLPRNTKSVFRPENARAAQIYRWHHNNNTGLSHRSQRGYLHSR